jgi:hypothetical protein
MKKIFSRKTKNVKRACQFVAIHVVLLMVLFSNEPFRIEGPHAIVYDVLANSFLNVQFSYGLFAKPRIANTHVSFLAKYASGNSVEWSPVDLDNTPFLAKGYEALMRTWLDENIGDYGEKTNKLLLRDAARYAAHALEKPGDEIGQVEIYKTVESIPAPNSSEQPRVIERTLLFTMSPKEDSDAGLK